jgi:hypothetical protein
MDTNSSLIWRELLASAGPSSAIPRIVATQFCGKIGIEPVEVELKLVELMGLGAVAGLSEKELSRLAEHKRISGDFVTWDRADGSVTFLRVISPHTLRQSIVARTIEMQREIPVLQEEEASLRRQIAGDELSDLWRYLYKDEAQREWKRRLTEDPAATPPSTLANDFFRSAIRSLRSKLNVVLERQSTIASRLAELSRFEIPPWASASENDKSRRDSIPRDVQQEVWRRDQGRCVECGSQDRLEFDHIIPWSKGGAKEQPDLTGGWRGRFRRNW